MKKNATLLGMMGVVCVFSACSQDSVTAPKVELPINALTSSSSITAPIDSVIPVSSASQLPTDTTPVNVKPASSASIKPASSATVVTHDTVHTTVIISSTSNGPSPYMSSASTFCWTEGCEATVTPVTPTPASSASIIEIEAPSTDPTPPIVTENSMTDQRDNHVYKLERIAGVHWMSQNLNYASKSGSYCSTGEGATDWCEKYGRFYTHAMAARACPEGWRLPTKAEVEAADNAVEHEWWTVGGRFKLENDKIEYGLNDEQGYIWVDDNDNSSFRIKNYGGSENVHEFQTGSIAERAYNVRCVENQ
ncbi:MAG: hypothetical protein HUK20_05625 [Fibrobacter sp.]|nr:hypothetical protein [Fibrobacter sp.]